MANNPSWRARLAAWAFDLLQEWAGALVPYAEPVWELQQQADLDAWVDEEWEKAIAYDHAMNAAAEEAYREGFSDAQREHEDWEGR
jgi:hypothetical protein